MKLKDKDGASITIHSHAAMSLCYSPLQFFLFYSSLNVTIALIKAICIGSIIQEICT